MGKRYKSARTIIAVVLVVAVMFGFGVDLYNIQVKNNDYYIAQSSAVKTYTVPIEAARGDIVDRNGNVLVTNRKGNSIVLNAAYYPSAKDNDERNEIIVRLIELFNKNGEEYVHNLPLKFNSSGEVVFFDKSDDEKYETDIKNMKGKDMLNVQAYATARNCFDAMVEKYGLESYDEKTALEIGNIRYELTRLLFSVSNPVTIADDVSDETVAEIKENNSLYPGADVSVVAYRTYTDSSLAAHIIGTVRKINGDEYKKLKDSGYGINDDIGESGIEAACESELRGTSGEMTVTIDAEGNVTQTVTKEPVQGDTIVLTIDKDMQKIAEDNLREICLKTSSEATGAVVVEDIHDGSILAAANYPTYDLNDYYDDYDSLSKNSKKPLYNRFAMSAYAPGSAFKPLMSVAALEEGFITPDTRFTCSASYRVGEMTFGCLDAHGSINVQQALEHSCNVFYYNCASLMGIDVMNQYGRLFGLGQKTGVEIPEASGILAGPEYRKKFDMTWNPGDTVQAAIGQSENLVTPLQLANYCATVANNGTRYKTHFVKSTISKSTGAVTDANITVEEKTGISDATFETVKGGMRRVGINLFQNQLQVKTPVACKTGTSQVYVNGVKKNNGFLISFAPYDNPEISVASAIETAGTGSSTAQITGAVIDYYYTQNNLEEKAQTDETLLE